LLDSKTDKDFLLTHVSYTPSSSSPLVIEEIVDESKDEKLDQKSTCLAF